MTERKDFKKVVRDRMAVTGENYTAARAALEPSEPGTPPSWTLRELLRASFAEAKRLDSGYLGPSHALVALLRADGDAAPKRALTSAGMTIEIAEAGTPAAPVRSDSIGTNPAWQATFGRAEGIAFASGVEPCAEHFVIAMLWHENIWRRFDAQVPRESVIAELRRAGVPLPTAAPPAIDDWAPTQQVPVPGDALDAVLEELAKIRKDNGVRFGFNYEPDGSAFVVSDDRVDLAAVVAMCAGDRT